MDPGDELNDLRMSDKARPLFDHVNKFIRETVEPMSVEFYRLGEKKTDRWSFAPGQLDVLQKAKDKAKARASGTSSCPTPRPAKASAISIMPISRRNSARTRWPRKHELLGARHRQHGSAGARRHQGAEGEVAEAAAGRRDPLRLCDDRTERRVVRRQEHFDHGKAGRRRMGHQRREILHFRRRRSALQDHDRDGQDQSGRAAEQPAVADPGAEGHARRRDHRAR